MVSREFSRNFWKAHRLELVLETNVGATGHGWQINPRYRSTRRDPSAAFVSGRRVGRRENRNLASLDPTQLIPPNNLAKSFSIPRDLTESNGRN